MNRLESSRLAAQDLNQIRSFIAQDKPIAANEFVDLIEKKYRLLATTTVMGTDCSKLAPGLRCFSVGKYAFIFAARRAESRLFACCTVPVILGERFVATRK